MFEHKNTLLSLLHPPTSKYILFQSVFQCHNNFWFGLRFSSLKYLPRGFLSPHIKIPSSLLMNLQTSKYLPICLLVFQLQNSFISVLFSFNIKSLLFQSSNVKSFSILHLLMSKFLLLCFINLPSSKSLPLYHSVFQCQNPFIYAILYLRVKYLPLSIQFSNVKISSSLLFIHPILK